jgi:hypothetical protein
MIKIYSPIVLTLALVATLAAGCDHADRNAASHSPTVPAANAGVGTAPASPASPASRPASPASPAGPVTAEPVGLSSTHPTWPTGPVTVVHHPAVPPVPVVTAIRYAAHPEQGYDRFVVDIPGALPGYTAKYVTKVVADGSGEPIAVPGKYYLFVVLNPAQAHRADGSPTVSGVHTLTLPQIKGYAIAGDYEGYVSIAIGLAGKAGFHIGELPGRLYIDVAA